MLRIIKMNYRCIFTALTGILLASSCDKHEVLSSEQAGLDAEIQQGIAELQSLDSQIAALNTNNVLPELQHGNWLKKNISLEKGLADLSKKCTQGDELLKKLHAKLDAYKALNAQ